MTDYLDFVADFTKPDVVDVYDELPLWSATFGLLLLEHVPLRANTIALDVGCGTGFPLLELAQRLGPGSVVHGLDPWELGLARARQKASLRQIENVVFHSGSAASMPFDDATFDLVVSNLGLNNFDDPNACIAECRRVMKRGATLALTTNLVGHMREFYDVFATIDGVDRDALHEHIEHRATIAKVRELLHEFEIVKVIEDSVAMRFANGTALLNHYFIKLGFLDAWKSVVPAAEQRRVFAELEQRLDRELCLTIPRAYIEAVL
ncbi:MAG TPA: class I SAM-dependent methyltransferase [Thermoanaerobaculia bacterium]|nr:class I SAM-dependent methyltransferase [Thermoanaerobaculia bacterium]